MPEQREAARAGDPNIPPLAGATGWGSAGIRRSGFPRVLRWRACHSPGHGHEGDAMNGATGMKVSKRLPMTDAQIRAVTVGEVAPPARITLAEYDPAWPALYAREA